MTADQLLQEAIINLQKQGLCAEARHSVDEAAQLLADGRDIEARALVEKAQAITVADVHSKTNRVTKVSGPMAGERMEPTIISRISGVLAQGITNALTEVIEELHLNFGAQMKDVVSSLEDRLTDITSQLKALSHLHERVERIAEEETARASAAQERWDRLSATITSFQEADHARRVVAEQFSRDVSGELETISSRVTAQEERIEALNRLVQDLSPKVISGAEQIDRHTDLLRSMQEHQSQRVAALNEVLDAMTKLREPKPLANVSAPA
jgi:chromosome segregation ATPase